METSPYYQKARYYGKTEASFFMGDHNLEQNFPIVKLDGANVQMNNRLEFYLEESLYSVVFHHPYTSAYKWLQSILYYQEKQAFEEDGVLL